VSLVPAPTSTDDVGPDPGGPAGEAGPLGDLPRLSAQGVAFRRRLARSGDLGPVARDLLPGVPIVWGTTEVVWRATGLGRPGVIAQLAWPRLDARLAIGIETPLAHAMVDHLLGFGRLPAEVQRQVTPVEWGILAFVAARALDRLDARPGPLAAWDLTIDRVGPDPFDPRGLGPVVTWRWPARLGPAEGSIRLWVPASILDRLEDAPPPPAASRPTFAGLSATWRAEAGTITLARGLSRIKKGTILPIDGATIGGTVASPAGTITLLCRDRDGRCRIDAEAAPNSSAARVVVKSPLRREPTPREPIAVNPTPNAPATSPSAPPDVPVTLVVELGRINLPLARLADLKPGDVLELGRHSREPVELTSNGRLVARGELVQIDTELGVRVLSVFL